MEHSLIEFLPRGKCGPWEPYLMVIYLLANFLIFAAYLSIPIQLLILKKSGFLIGTRMQTIFWASFILFCGLGHLFENVGSFWFPNYHFFTLWHCLTAAISVFTAITFPKAIVVLLANLNQMRREKCLSNL